MKSWKCLWTSKKNCNTKKKTISDLRKWYGWCESVGECRKIGKIPPTELDRLLGHFFCKVRKSDDSLYEPDTLTSFQRSSGLYLTQELRKPYSIIRDTRFSSSREKLKAARKMHYNVCYGRLKSSWNWDFLKKLGWSLRKKRYWLEFITLVNWLI